MWYCKHCKKNVRILIDTYDIDVGDDTPHPDEIARIVRDCVEWDVICADCEGPVEWRD